MSQTAIEALQQARQRMRNCWGAIQSDQVIDKDVEGSLKRGMDEIDAALSALTQGGVKVKELAWVKHPDGSHESALDHFGNLYLATDKGWRHTQGEWNELQGMEQSKAAAQQDYDARILSALSTTLQEPVGEIGAAAEQAHAALKAVVPALRNKKLREQALAAMSNLTLALLDIRDAKDADNE